MTEIVKKAKQEMQGIELSENAISHLKKELKKQSNAIGVRFSVKKTGCSGLSYVIDYAATSNDDDKCFVLNNDLTIYIDKKAYLYLRGLKVDFVTEGLNKKFIFENPNQTGQCGCGESFTVDEKFRD